MISNATDRFHLLAEVVSLQVWTAGPDGGLDWANQECAQYFQAEIESQILGTAWAQFVHPQDLPLALKGWERSLASGERYEMEFRLRRHDGEYRWFLVRAQAMRAASGAIEQWFGTNTDIHDLKTAQHGAEAASRAKDAFLAALSHELRTPLAPVLMMARSMADDENLPLEARDNLRMIERNIALEARLIDDLLDLTRIAQGQLRLRAEPCDTHSLIGLAVEIVRDDAFAKSIAIERSFAAELSGLVADPARFQQVIWNLLRNAVKFTPRGGRISIRTENERIGEAGSMLRIKVTDTGAGIEKSALERIFLPFEQVEPLGEHRFGGVGLGLAIARAIVDLHGGTITARSAGQDRGSTFVVQLPGAISPPHGVSDSIELFPRGSTPSALLVAPEPNPEVAPLRLLLVEDHEATMMVLSKLLRTSGHRVTEARDVAEALAAAGCESFDLVISDLGLPDGTGTELMQKLRATYNLRGIALSGYGMDEDVRRSLEAGFTAHLTKPVDYGQLERALRLVQAEA
ncbi:MAG: hybrid sensor histidine kinase/response regulator [Chthoniobacterales bacterium]